LGKGEYNSPIQKAMNQFYTPHFSRGYKFR